MIAALQILFRSLVRVLLRKGITFPETVAILKQLYVTVAAEEFRIEGRLQSASRIALLTGLSRQEVSRTMKSIGQEENLSDDNSRNRCMALLHGWLHDENFLAANEQPLVLSLSSDDSEISFEDLVRKHGGDIPTRAWLDELSRLNLIEILSDSSVKLKSPGYVPTSNQSEMIEIGFSSVADLINTINHNDQAADSDSRLQPSVVYDRVTAPGVDAFRYLSREKSKELLLYLDKFLHAHDQPDSGATPVKQEEIENLFRTGLSIFYFEGETNNVQNESDNGNTA